MSPLCSLIGNAFICVLCISIAFFPTEGSSFTPNTGLNTQSYNRIATAAFAFPDSRKHDSNKKSRQNRSARTGTPGTGTGTGNGTPGKNINKSILNQQRKFKRTEDDDDAPVLSNQGSLQPQPKRRFGSRNQYASLFTKELTAQPLEQLQLPKQQQDNHELILSPSVIQNNQQECMTNISGELPVIYTNDPKTVEKWLTEHCSSQVDGVHSVLGFDVEAAPNLPWRKPTNPDFINRPATVQLSTPYSSIVVHLTERPTSPRGTSTSILSPLVAMLSDETILKVGAGINEDMLELYRWNPCLDARSRFDIGGVGSDSNRSRVGLQKLVRAIVGVEMVKSKKVSMSDWSQIPLTNAQLCYASRDAWAGAAVMENIGRMHDVMQVDSIASLVKGNERSMADVDMRARTRKRTKIKMKDILSEAKDMALPGKERYEDLLQAMPQKTKEEIKRLQRILDETAPDDLIFFDAEKFGLDFTFVEQ